MIKTKENQIFKTTIFNGFRISKSSKADSNYHKSIEDYGNYYDFMVE
jgi:hypothetical protein